MIQCFPDYCLMAKPACFAQQPVGLSAGLFYKDLNGKGAGAFEKHGCSLCSHRPRHSAAAAAQFARLGARRSSGSLHCGRRRCAGPAPGQGLQARDWFRTISAHDDAGPGDCGRKAKIQTAATDGGTGLWDYKKRAGISAVPAAWMGEDKTGMDFGESGLRLQTAVPAGSAVETGGSRIKI